ncbi:hypothetical protein LCGC14_1665360 [marine sediment metagenome]|uniref:Uncharacterized protein n=1 Tax=marine sediment metagenome TaxID=412755 RepID=A0A0F9HTK2_9ZZZZ
MGVDYYAYAIIGLRIPRDKIIGTVTKHKNLCKCDPQTEQMGEEKFCDKCGKLLDHTYKGDDPKFGVGMWEIQEKGLKGWPVVSDGDYGNYFYIGIRKAYYADYKPVGIRDTGLLVKLENKFKMDMEKLGLWDPDAYGLWSVLQVSC